MFNLSTVVSMAAIVVLISWYPYPKLYHDLRGGSVLKLVSFVKLSKFLSIMTESHFDDYNIEMFKAAKAATSTLVIIEFFVLNIIYNSRINADLVFNAMVIYFHMATLNILLSSMEALAYSIFIVMITKYILAIKTGKTNEETIHNMMSSKFSDLWRDAILVLTVLSISGANLSVSLFSKVFLYFATIIFCICKRSG